MRVGTAHWSRVLAPPQSPHTPLLTYAMAPFSQGPFKQPADGAHPPRDWESRQAGKPVSSALSAWLSLTGGRGEMRVENGPLVARARQSPPHPFLPSAMAPLSQGPCRQPADGAHPFRDP